MTYKRILDFFMASAFILGAVLYGSVVCVPARDVGVACVLPLVLCGLSAGFCLAEGVRVGDRPKFYYCPGCMEKIVAPIKGDDCPIFGIGLRCSVEGCEQQRGSLPVTTKCKDHRDD